MASSTGRADDSWTAYLLDGDVVRETKNRETVGEAIRNKATVWLDLSGPAPDVLELLENDFGIHHLTLKDVWADREVPKVEDFGTYLHIIAHSIRTKDKLELELRELDVLLGKTFIVTHTHERELIGAVREELVRSRRAFRKGPAYVAHAILDHLVDDYIPVLDVYDAEIAELEEEILVRGSKPRAARQIMTRIFTLKSGLAALRRTTLHQRETLLRLARAEFDEIPREAAPFFRDVYDHFTRVTDLADSYRELLTSLLEAHLSVQSHRLNEVMKTLTLMSTIMLPLTFIAGVYGMNFDRMPELKWYYGYPFALALMALVAIAIVLWFRRKHWL